MKFTDALTLFKDEVKKALDSGHEINGVEAEPGANGEILIIALSPDNSVLTAVGIDQQGLLAGLVEFAFAQATGQVEALHKLKHMP